MLGIEAMIFQGWPIGGMVIPIWVRDGLLQGLAGNAVSPPVMLGLVMAALTSITWRIPAAAAAATESQQAASAAATDADVSEALGLMDFINNIRNGDAAGGL